MDFQNLDSEIKKELEEEILFSAIEESLEKEKIQENKKAKKTNKRKKYTSNTTVKSGLKIRTVLLLILTLLVNTYAWFIYISTVSMGISMHVKDWNFELSNGDQTQNFEFIVEQIYPGMETAIYDITAKNTGETSAELSCELLSVEILGDEYLGTESGGTYTSDELFEILESYPFKIQIYFNDILYDGSQHAMITDEETAISFRVSWEYETGDTDDEIESNDEIDTYWGSRAYQYAAENTDNYSIKVKIKVQAVQSSADNMNP